jgi:hypothetical protein
MYPRTEYEMTPDDLSALYEAFKPVPYIVIGGHAPRSQQENANAAWAALGKRMGFDGSTVRPISGKGNRFFSAIPSENETQRAERVAREQEAQRQREIAQLQSEIDERQERLRKLCFSDTSKGGE